jgi:hypothetical protein
MDAQTIFNAVIAVAGFLAGMILNNIYRAIERLDKDVRMMPSQYVPRDDYRNDVREIRDMLAKIFDKLDNKVDK